MKQLLLFVSLLFIIGCGGGGGGTESTPPDDPNNDTQASVEPYYYQQWHLDKNDTFYISNLINNDAHIHPTNLFDQYRGETIKIAVIDDGLDVDHEDLIGAISNTFDSQTKGTDVSHTSNNDYHGTAVTGIIAAQANGKGIYGVAPKAEIIFIKHQISMTEAEFIELFTKADDFGADIISCSWGTGDVSDALKAKIQDLAINGRGGKGILIVFAAGNTNSDMGNDESAIPEVIAVGSTNKDNDRAYYSNYGSYLDILAPGGESLGITTLDPMGLNGIASIDEDYLLYNDSNAFAGTSASAPIVSGLLALMLEKDSALTRVQIETILKNSSDKIGVTPYDVNGRNDYYGYGKINLTNAMNEI